MLSGRGSNVADCLKRRFQAFIGYVADWLWFPFVNRQSPISIDQGHSTLVSSNYGLMTQTTAGIDYCGPEEMINDGALHYDAMGVVVVPNPGSPVEVYAIPILWVPTGNLRAFNFIDFDFYFYFTSLSVATFLIRSMPSLFFSMYI